MALCGGFKIGVDISEPKTPPLVIVKVPPWRSSTLIVPWRRPGREVGDGLLDRGERDPIRVADDRDHESALGADSHADVVEILIDDLVALDAAR